jgi:very-short-patch-repair endonuclease/predicted nucleic acid-binding Zn ribbon protein
MACTGTYRKLCKGKCDFCHDRSFASHRKSKYWADNGGVMPRDVFKHSNKNYFFHCKDCKHVFAAKLNNVNKGYWCNFCSNKVLCDQENCTICRNKSFASHPKAQYWLDKENGISSRKVFKSSSRAYFFRCKDCDHKFKIVLNSVDNGESWCNFCSNKYLCKENCEICYNKSFASHPKAQYWAYNDGVTPRDVFMNSHKKYWFNCNECTHRFKMGLSEISRGSWCNFCSSNQLCPDGCDICYKKSFASHPKSSCWSMQDNKISPRLIFKSSGVTFKFICDRCKNKFNRTPASVGQGKWCPTCRNKTELKLFEWLKSQKFNVERQVKFDWCKIKKHLPFDFVIEELKLIIELDGPQHFRQVANWTSPEITQEKDVFKMRKMSENGYSMIRLLQEDVLYDKFNWQEILLSKITKYEEPSCTFIHRIGGGNEYKYLMEVEI